MLVAIFRLNTIKSNAINTLFCDQILNGFSLVQYNTNPTRFDNVLDLVLCNDHTSLNCDVIIGGNIFKSDHESLCIQSYQNNHNTKNVYDWLLAIDDW